MAPPKEEIKTSDFELLKHNPRLFGVKDEENTLMKQTQSKFFKGTPLYNLHNLKLKTDENAYLFISKSQVFILRFEEIIMAVYPQL